MTDPYDDHATHGIATLSLTEEVPGGGLVYQSWKICGCTLSPLRAQLGTPHHQSMATAEQVEATGRAVLSVPGTTHLGEGL